MKIKMLVMDVDGTLTDGRIYIGPTGEVMKAFDVKDGYAIAHILPKEGITPVIITGRSSEIVKYRAGELKIKELHQGIGDKLAKLKEVAASYGVQAEEIAYIGDDVNDIDCMKYCGIAACPADALDEAKVCADYICKCDGGRGALREFVSYLLK